MDTIKPTKIGVKVGHQLTPTSPLTAAEMGKLWATYMGNSMCKQILTHFLQHVDDKDIQKIIKDAYILTNSFLAFIENVFQQEKFPIPVGFTSNDLKQQAPRLFKDEFYLHYLKYTAKAGMSIYSIGIPIMFREDIRTFFETCIKETLTLLHQINVALIEKGFLTTPPTIPIPKEVSFVEKQSYLKGFIGDVRPLHALEIAHLYDNIENNTVSKALLIAFNQVAKKKSVKGFLTKGHDITAKSVDSYMHYLYKEGLPSLPLLDHLVTESTISPFSDKLMVFHKIDMFSMKIRAFGNSMSVDGRRDLAATYLSSLTKIGLYVEDGANIMIENGWMEQPPQASNRQQLFSP